MNAQKLFVDRGRQRQCTERVHASIIYPLRILVLALEFEREVVRQVSTFMVPAKEEEGIWIPDLECPQVKNALQAGHTFSCD